MELAEAFGPAESLAVVGAGGKKSTLYALAAELGRAVVTATVRIPPFEDSVARVAVTDDPVGTLAANDDWPLGAVAGRDEDRSRYLGYAPDVVDSLIGAADVPVLIKADGARTRWLKAPNDREPQLPGSVDLVVPIASVRAVGRELDAETVHRPERVAAITGRSVGDRITPGDVAAVLTSEAGGLKAVPEDARVAALLNMVDDDDLGATARRIADRILEEPRIERVVLSRMDRGRIVAVRR